MTIPRIRTMCLAETLVSEKTILTVDDNEQHRYAVRHTLERSGFKTISAANGSEAIAAASEHPDLVLLDVHLPDFDGFEVCRRLKAHPNTSSIPIVMYSGRAQDGMTVQDARQLGAWSFLFFPVEAPHLLAVVEGAISHSRDRSRT